MVDYIERVTEIYAAIRESGVVDQSDVAELTMAVMQEEAKDRRTVELNDRKDQRVKQMRFDEQSQSSSDTQSWREEPATEAQKKALDNLGVDYPADMTKGAASNLIDEAKSSQAEA